MIVYEVVHYNAESKGDYRNWIKNNDNNDVVDGLVVMAVNLGRAEILETCPTKEQAIEAYNTYYKNWIHTDILNPGHWAGIGYGINIDAIVIWESGYDEDLELIQSEIVAEYAEVPEV